jgi:hypothetical protein
MEFAYKKINATNEDMSFDFAKAEYIRLIHDNPERAIPFLKIMATKASEANQWQIVESLIVSSILAWTFTNASDEIQTFVYEICKTRWFSPGLLVKDPKQQEKVQRLLDIITSTRRRKNKFTKVFASISRSKDYRGFIKKIAGRYDKNNKLISDALSFAGKTASGKNLMEMSLDHKTSDEDKFLLNGLRYSMMRL